MSGSLSLYRDLCADLIGLYLGVGTKPCFSGAFHRWCSLAGKASASHSRHRFPYLCLLYPGSRRVSIIEWRGIKGAVPIEGAAYKLLVLLPGIQEGIILKIHLFFLRPSQFIKGKDAP